MGACLHHHLEGGLHHHVHLEKKRGIKSVGIKSTMAALIKMCARILDIFFITPVLLIFITKQVSNITIGIHIHMHYKVQVKSRLY